MSDKVPGENLSMPMSNRKKLLICFAIGFLVTFIGMMFLSQGYYDGKSLRNTKLWQYYILTFVNDKETAKLMGSSSGNQNAAKEVALTHLSISLAVGVVSTGIGWFTYWFRQRKSSSTNR